jgi:plastocyanin domain-containing protein
MAKRIRASIYGLAAVSMAAAVACSRSEATATTGAGPTNATVASGQGSTKVTVDAKGFTPSEVRIEKGKPASLVFVRTTDSTCARQVVFPELKLEKDLPLNTAVSIDVPTDKGRTLTFQCGMGMYKSSVVID